MHLVHMPLQVPQAQLEKFSNINNRFRKEMHAMVNLMDQYIGEVVKSLKDTGLYENSLIVVHGDNGGEIMTEFCGGNNFPLRGGKFSTFEGGIRVPSFVTGGFLPLNRRGKLEENLISIADWYSTYAAIAGVDNVIDKKAELAGLPPIDSMNCWPLLKGESNTCRNEIPIGDTSAIGFNMDGNALVGGLIQGKYKLLLGAENKGFHVDQDVTTGVLFPNSTDILIPELHPKVCSRDILKGCLYNIYDDPSEGNNLATLYPDLFNSMLSRIDDIQKTVYSPVRGHKNPIACDKAIERNYYWGPFLELY